MKRYRALWQDEAGMINSAELILISTLLIIGSIVGLATFRDQIVQEFGDLGLAVGKLNQGYSYNDVNVEITIDGTDYTFTAAGSNYADLADFCEETPTAGEPPACISVTQTPSEEGN
jgi:hypothetical protein